MLKERFLKLKTVNSFWKLCHRLIFLTFTPQKRGNFICHMGPPKTATTSLQMALQALDDHHISYLGTFQPRFRNNDRGIYAMLASAAFCVRVRRKLVKKIRREIDASLNRKIDLIMSEEMILLDQKNMPFQKKLEALGRIIGQYSPLILITIREPIAAIKSLYIELYYRNPQDRTPDFSDFLMSNQVKIYDYLYLVGVLHASGFDNIRFISINNGHMNYCLSEITGFERHNQIITIGKHNVSELDFKKVSESLIIPDEMSLSLNASYSSVMSRLTKRIEGFEVSA